MRKENKNNDFIHQFLLFRLSLQHAFTKVPRPCFVMLSWMCVEEPEEKKLLNKVVIFVFFAHKKYSCGFINVLTTFLGLERGSSLVVYGGSESSWISPKFLNLWWRSYRFGTTWGWVINDRIFIFGRTIPLISLSSMFKCRYTCITEKLIFLNQQMSFPPQL